MNKVTLIGRLTKDPELKYTPGAGTAVGNHRGGRGRRADSGARPWHTHGEGRDHAADEQCCSEESCSVSPLAHVHIYHCGRS